MVMQEMAKAARVPLKVETGSFKLWSGHSIPAVGLGTWKSGSQVADAVFTTIVEVGVLVDHRGAILPR